MIISDVRDDVLAEMDTLVDEGVTTFKLFTAYPGVFFTDDGAIFRAMQQTAKNGGLIMMHAENGLAIDVVAGQNFAAGNTDPYYHGTSRSPVLEGEATNRVIRLAEVAGAPVYIVHLSAREALNEVRRARDEGLPAFAETCPQYLFLSLEDMGNGFDGAKFVCSPPLRPGRPPGGPVDRACSRTTCRSSPPTTARSTSTARRRWDAATSARSRTGCPASRTGWTCCTAAAWSEGRLTPNRWVEVISAAPARMFGLPQKGAVQVGLDADLVIYDPQSQAHHQRQHPPHGRRLLLLRGLAR